MCVCFWLCCCRQDQSVSTLFCLLLAPTKPPGVQRALAGSKAGRLLHVSLKPTSQRAVYWLSTNQSALIGANHFLSLTVCGRAVCVSNQCDVVHYIWEVICPMLAAGDSRTVSSFAVTYCCFLRITKLSTSASEPAPLSLPPLDFLFIFSPLCSGNSHQAQRQFTVPLNTSLTVPSCVHQRHGEHDFITQFDSIQGSFPTFFMHRELSSGRK